MVLARRRQSWMLNFHAEFGNRGSPRKGQGDHGHKTWMDPLKTKPQICPPDILFFKLIFTFPRNKISPPRIQIQKTGHICRIPTRNTCGYFILCWKSQGFFKYIPMIKIHTLLMKTRGESNSIDSTFTLHNGMVKGYQ